MRLKKDNPEANSVCALEKLCANNEIVFDPVRYVDEAGLQRPLSLRHRSKPHTDVRHSRTSFMLNINEGHKYTSTRYTIARDKAWVGVLKIARRISQFAQVRKIFIHINTVRHPFKG